MRQVGFKKDATDFDVSPATIESAISILYTPYINKTIEEVKFQILLPGDVSDYRYLKDSSDLKSYNIDIILCDVLQKDSWVVFCPDTNDVFISKGSN